MERDQAGSSPQADFRRWDWFTAFAVAILLVLVSVTFQDYGVSNDEEVQQLYGEKLLAFYLSAFSDLSAFNFKDLYYYGGLFDMVAAVIQPWLPFDPYESRHLLSTVVGLAGIVGGWRLARLLAGPRAGFFAVVLLSITGAWYGGMFNHTKDVPFAAAMTWGLYYLCRMLEEMPRPRLSTVLWFGGVAGISLGIRVGGLLLGLYAAVAVVLWLLAASGGSSRDRLRTGGAMLLRLLPGVVPAYLIMAFSWPWSVFDPLNPMRALEHFSHVDFRVYTIFAGTVMKIYDVPAAYLPVYLIIKLPMVLLAGLLLAMIWAFGGRRTAAPYSWLSTPRHLGFVLTALAAVFPIVWFVIGDLPAYDGIRHFLFVVPPLAVLAAAGLDRTLIRMEQVGVTAGRLGAAALAVAVVLQVSVLVRLHPYEYVDYNSLVGGLAGAQRKYVMDYWANTVPEATRALADHVRREYGARGAPRSLTVYVCSERMTFEATAPAFLVWTRDADRADFFIAPTHMNCDYPEEWARPVTRGRTIYEVRRLGVLLAVVRDLRGVTASKASPPRS